MYFGFSHTASLHMLRKGYCMNDLSGRLRTTLVHITEKLESGHDVWIEREIIGYPTVVGKKTFYRTVNPIPRCFLHND